jgi:hypothetical protein
MGERGRMSQVSVNEVSCVCLESLEPPEGAPSFPFYRSRKDLGYMREREREKEKEE